MSFSTSTLAKRTSGSRSTAVCVGSMGTKRRQAQLGPQAIGIELVGGLARHELQDQDRA